MVVHETVGFIDTFKDLLSDKDQVKEIADHLHIYYTTASKVIVADREKVMLLDYVLFKGLYTSLN